MAWEFEPETDDSPDLPHGLPVDLDQHRHDGVSTQCRDDGFGKFDPNNSECEGC